MSTASCVFTMPVGRCGKPALAETNEWQSPLCEEHLGKCREMYEDAQGRVSLRGDGELDLAAS
jgi:hypothetical protein